MAFFQNDVIEVSLIGSMQGQPIFNILHYVRESLGATPADAFFIGESWQADFMAQWLTLFTAGYRLEAIRVQRIIEGGTNSKSRLPPINNGIGLPGTRIGENNPACQHIWVSYISSVVDPDIWIQGGSALTAGAEEDIIDGSVTGPIEADLNGFFEAIKVPWTPSVGGTDDVLQWSVLSRVRFNSLQIPFIIMVDRATVRLNVSASEKRRKGTARGAFQP